MPADIPLLPWSLDALPPLSDAPGAPIALFDSGVGGLTVLAALRRALPAEAAVYIADQAHVPYGGRPLDEVRQLAGSITRFAASQGVKAVVMACNISSATSQPALADAYGPGRIFGMVQPGARAAAAASARGVIGVLATEGTVRSAAYSQALKAARPGAQVIEVPCPDFVPLVESGQANSAAAERAAAQYLAPIEAAGADVVVLGCTHYPFLTPRIQRAARTPLTLIDPAEAVVQQLQTALRHAHRAAPRRAGPDQLYTTGDPVRFRAQLQAIQLCDAPVAPLSWRPTLI